MPDAAPTPVTCGMFRSADEATIAALARDTNTDREVVKYFYDEELALLHAHASIKNFIGIIAARRVRERLVTADTHRRFAALSGTPVRQGQHAPRSIITRAA